MMENKGDKAAFHKEAVAQMKVLLNIKSGDSDYEAETHARALH